MIVYSGLKWVIVVYMFGITTISNNPKPHQTISNKKEDISVLFRMLKI